MKKKVYIVSHSHWDREWYMAYEQHHMRLVELMDDLLELFETDEDFHSFHLDGQTILLDDYLEVRPEKKEAVQAAITAGKLQIGPFYILQDDFLISSESNVRNMLIGVSESEKWGTPVALGYFPDTFGNMGQAPQLMLQAGLKRAAFGRGVKPIGFDNEVLPDDNYASQYSEMYWDGPDGSRIFGLLFANWYSNGNEIPVDKQEAQIFWQKKLADVEKYGSTRHLLMMNGVDHQPVQKDVTEAIRVANELFPEYEFVHSSFTEYLDAVEGDLPENIGTVQGELTSQETDGWYTLANTASSRVYLKQWNTKVSRQLENIAEPLSAMAYELTGNYPHDQLDYAWKLLLQNHPHDSICGCSVDEVHREMIPRFEKSFEVGKFLADEALTTLTEAIDTKGFPENSWPFVVFNTTGVKRSDIAEVEISLERKLFKEGIPSELFRSLKNAPSKNYQVIDAEGRVLPADIGVEEVRFNYDLPKEAFRIPYMEKFVKVRVMISEMPAFSWETMTLVISEASPSVEEIVKDEGRVLENDKIKVIVAKDGSLSLTNKQLDQTLDNLLVFENVGDIGNEYIFKQPAGDNAILSTDFPYEIEILENSTVAGSIRLTHQMRIPPSADELLAVEQQAVVEFRHRQAQRSEELIDFKIETVISLDRETSRVSFQTTVDNQAKDHRLRVMFPTGLASSTHVADSIYETVVRNNQPSEHWENPSNPQHQHAFVSIHDSDVGVTVNNFGLNEYEIVENTIALTLLRCTGEMGDWGYFPTPEAQCQGEHTLSYGIEFHAAEDRFEAYKQAQALQVPLVAAQSAHHEGQWSAIDRYIDISGETFAVTALKRHKVTQQLILRGYNLSEKTSLVSVKKDSSSGLVLLNLLEKDLSSEVSPELSPYEIRTIGFKEDQ